MLFNLLIAFKCKEVNNYQLKCSNTNFGTNCHWIYEI